MDVDTQWPMRDYCSNSQRLIAFENILKGQLVQRKDGEHKGERKNRFEFAQCQR